MSYFSFCCLGNWTKFIVSYTRRLQVKKWPTKIRYQFLKKTVYFNTTWVQYLIKKLQKGPTLLHDTTRHRRGGGRVGGWGQSPRSTPCLCWRFCYAVLSNWNHFISPAARTLYGFFNDLKFTCFNLRELLNLKKHDSDMLLNK